MALLCVLAIAGILVSPAVPSPPTVVGKTVHSAVPLLELTALPPACGQAAAVALGTPLASDEVAACTVESAADALSLPLRR